MLERLTGTLLVAFGEPGTADPEAHHVRYCLLAGRQVMSRGETTAARLAALGGYDVRASFFDRSAYFDRATAQTANARLAAVVARRHIDGEMLFNESYRLRLAMAPSGEMDVTLKMAVATELACARLEDALPLASRPVSLVTMEETAIAALVARVTETPALVCFARGERFLAFVAEQGEVKLRRTETLPAGDQAAAQDAADRADAGLSMGLNPVGASQAPALRLYLGDLRFLAAQAVAARDYASREVEKKIAGLFKGADVLAEPELFGLRFARRHWNMLEPAQTWNAMAWQIAVPTAAVLAGGAAVAGIFAAFAMLDNSRADSNIRLAQAKLNERKIELARLVPEESEMKQLADLTRLMQKRAEQVRVDRLLSWISHRLPDGVTIASMQVYPVGDAPPETPRKADGSGSGQDIFAKLFPVKTQPQAQSDRPAPTPKPGLYEVSLELSLPGAYETVEAQAAQSIRHLAERLSFTASILDYDATASRARLVSRLTVSAEDFRKP